MGPEVNEYESHISANAALHNERPALFVDLGESPVPSDSFSPERMEVDTPPASTNSMLRLLGEQDHGSYNGMQPRGSPCATTRDATTINNRDAGFGLSTNPHNPAARNGESVMQDANQCFVCYAQFSTPEKLRGHLWFYQVRSDSIQLKLSDVTCFSPRFRY